MTRPLKKSLFIVCGETSGETYAVNVARVFRRRYPDVPIEAIGGERLKGEGVSLVADYSDISVVGLTEVISHLPAIRKTLEIAIRNASRKDVGAVLLVDFPDFNFRVGRKAKAAGVPVVYYVPPQLWAWRKGRAKELARFTEGVVVPFPFEKPVLERAGVNVCFAGHPLMDELARWFDAEPDSLRFGIPPGRTVVGLLPGSRRSEIRSHLEPILEAARILSARNPDLHFVIPVASREIREDIEKAVLNAGLEITLVGEDRHLLFRGMTAAIAASGTATLELALLGVPHVIVYRTSALTYWIGCLLTSVDCIGLPNIVAGERFLPELIHSKCNPRRMAEELSLLLDDHERRRELREKCLSLRAMLVGDGPAEAVVDMLGKAAGGAWA